MTERITLDSELESIMNHGNILLIEDNEDDILLTMRAFKKANVVNQVVVLRDGAEALEYITGKPDAPPPIPAVILLDLKLPKVSGLEVLEKIRGDARLRLVRTIILTTSKEEVDITKSYELGAASYIRKPVDFEKFLEAVAALGMYWLLLNEPPPPVKATE
ncbi:MAG: response regulator [Fimbriiglobus sp.]